MNPYLQHLKKIEFVVTDACTGRCKHCSEGEHGAHGARIDARAAADAVRRIASEYAIETVMTFGGEPLLHTEAVEAIHMAARDAGVPHRQLITNGYFSRDPARIGEVAERLLACGVNDLLLSVDAFHQETIPLSTVKHFAREVVRVGVPIRLSPAWLVSREDDNPYNRQTREILASFRDMGIPTGEGNVVFPEGNARIYLSDYFRQGVPENPYREDPCDVGCVSFAASGDVLGANVYTSDIMEILKHYRPTESAERRDDERK